MSWGGPDCVLAENAILVPSGDQTPPPPIRPLTGICLGFVPSGLIVLKGLSFAKRILVSARDLGEVSICVTKSKAAPATPMTVALPAEAETGGCAVPTARVTIG